MPDPEKIDRGDDFTPTNDDAPLELTGDLSPDVLESVIGEASLTDPPADKGDKGNDFVPVKAVIEERRKRQEAEEEATKLRAENAALKGTAPEPAAAVVAEPAGKSDIDLLADELEAKRTAHQEALVDGDLTAARALQGEMDKINRQIAKAEIRAEDEQARAAAEVTNTLSSVAKEAFALYPFLDIKAEGHDIDAINSVNARRSELQAQGKSPAEALKLAVEEKGPKFAKINGVEVSNDAQQKVREARELAARTKAAAASVQQPANVRGSDKETFTVDVKNLSDEEFDKLPASVKAKARGDQV